MKVKKISDSSLEIIVKDKSIGTLTKYDIERLFNSQVGSSLNFYSE